MEQTVQLRTATQVPSLVSVQASTNKRIASSLLEQQEDKKMRDEEPPSEWPAVDAGYCSKAACEANPFKVGNSDTDGR